MIGIGPTFILSIVTFILCAWVIAIETRKGERLFLTSCRAWLDRIVDAVTIFFVTRLTYLGRHIIKLSWYYGIHKFLRFILTGLIKAYDLLEVAFMRNRDRARTLKYEKRTLEQMKPGHLGQMAEHKASTALTEAQKKRLLQKKLERE